MKKHLVEWGKQKDQVVVEIQLNFEDEQGKPFPFRLWLPVIEAQELRDSLAEVLNSKPSLGSYDQVNL